MKILTVIIASILLLSSCGDGSSKGKHGKGSEKAEEICDCVKEVVDLSDVTAENFDREMNKVDRNPEKKKKLAKCMKSTILTMIDEMEDLEDKERKEYIKAFMKGGIDCDCMDIVMDNVVKEMPTYMDMIKSVVKEIDVDGSSDRVVRSERNYDRIEPKYPDYDRGDSYEYDRYEEKTEERSYDYKGKSEEGYGEERMDYYDYEMEAAPEEGAADGAAEAGGDDE